MRYGLTTTAATVAAALLTAAGAILSGCAGSGDARTATTVTSPRVGASPARPAPADPGPPPPPEALTAVMSRLADPAVPGAEKLPLLQDSTPADAVTLDRFAAALRDGGFSPVAFTATDVNWAGDQPGDPSATVLATVTVTTTNPANPGDFSFPMEFHSGPVGWQLTRDTAEMLLAFGNSRTGLPAR